MKKTNVITMLTLVMKVLGLVDLVVAVALIGFVCRTWLAPIMQLRVATVEPEMVRFLMRTLFFLVVWLAFLLWLWASRVKLEEQVYIACDHRVSLEQIAAAIGAVAICLVMSWTEHALWQLMRVTVVMAIAGLITLLFAKVLAVMIDWTAKENL